MPNITIKTKGDFKMIEKFLKKLPDVKFKPILEKYGKRGVTELSAATPTDTGATGGSWGYNILSTKNRYTINWTNSNVSQGVPIAILIQYGHATRNGGYVQGRDFINPAITPILDALASDLWKEVISL